MDKKVGTKTKKYLMVEQAAEQWINLVFEHIKHNRRLQTNPNYIPEYKTDKNEKLYNHS